LKIEIANSRNTDGLKVLFDDIEINSNWYIICGSTNIQFGDTSLKTTGPSIGIGKRPKITIRNVPNYFGLIQNGTDAEPGKDYINVFNLDIFADGTTSIATGEGWVGQSYFGKGASNNYIVNCSSNGLIKNKCGGIVGSNAASGSGASLYIIGCSGSGNIALDDGGGIVGANSGNVSCQLCSSSGIIGRASGGIFGFRAGFSGTATADRCYSTGTINGNGAGGIFGSTAQDTCSATNCYSQGMINGPNSGGIFGNEADLTTATNCYSSGDVVGEDADGISGNNSSTTITNCYVAYGGWINDDANQYLTGTPPITSGSGPSVGTTWVSTSPNTPYELKNMGYTPYAFVNITTVNTPALKQIYEQTIQPGQKSSPGVKSGVTYTPLSGFDPTMSIESTGAIATTTSTPKGTYTLVIKNSGSYNITTFTLTLTSPPTPDSNICFPAGTPIHTDQGNIPIEKINPKVHTIRNKKIEGIVRTKLMDEYLVCFEKNSLGPNVPCERTVMSGNHKVVVNGQLKMARELLKAHSMSFGAKMHSTAIHAVKYNGQSMYNVLMEDYDVILVNNMVCETLDPDNKMADLHAHLKHMTHERQQMLIDKFNTKSGPVVSQINSSNAIAKMKMFR